MIIDYTYFIGKLRLPQTGNTEGREEIDGLIEIYEPEYLRKALGLDLYEAFTEGIVGSPGGYEQRWIDLLDGITFDYKGFNRKWNGFDPEDKLTPIANYVYYRYLEDTASDVTLAGTSTGKTDNNARTAPMQKMVNAWNDMVEMNHELHRFLLHNDAYPEYVDRQTDIEVFRFKNGHDL